MLGLLSALARLRTKGSRWAIGFDVMSVGEVQFFESVLRELLRRHPRALVILFHHDDTSAAAMRARYPELAARVHHVRFRRRLLGAFRALNLYVTTEQFVAGPPGVFTLSLFHGQPSKGLTFELPGHDVLAANDALFLYGPLQRQALDEHLARVGRRLPPNLALYEIGYTKSDALLSGAFERRSLLVGMGLDPALPTVLYAPAFNAGASMQEAGFDILGALCGMEGVNVLAKLAVDCLQTSSTGGRNWFDLIGDLEARYPRFRLVRTLEADPALAASDVLVTCVSSISFEFLALGRPVIFFDTPRFYAETLPRMLPGRDVHDAAQRTVVNAGREFGPVVSKAEELPSVVRDIFARPDAYPYRRNELPERLVYNPGKATAAAVDRLEALVASGARSRRDPASNAVPPLTLAHLVRTAKATMRARRT